jgi:mannose-6-phosphate isomerase
LFIILRARRRVYSFKKQFRLQKALILSLCTFVWLFNKDLCGILLVSMSLLANHHEENRPWGSFEQFTLNESSTVKILRVDAGKEFSLQKHEHRSEYWKVIEGNGTAIIGNETFEVNVGQVMEIPQGTLHRLKGGEHGIAVLEIALGDFDENDIERLEDDFGRV